MYYAPTKAMVNFALPKTHKLSADEISKGIQIEVEYEGYVNMDRPGIVYLADPKLPHLTGWPLLMDTNGLKVSQLVYVGKGRL